MGNIMRKLILVILLTVCTVVMADELYDMAQCDSRAVHNNLDCNFDSRKNQNACKARDRMGKSERLCNPILKQLYHTLSFLSEELFLIDDMYDKKKISKKERDEKYKAVEQMMHEEFTNGSKTYDEFWADMKARRLSIASKEAQIRILDEQERRSNLINSAISVLGGINRVQNNDVQTHTYSINGRLITCTTVGGLTTCN